MRDDSVRDDTVRGYSVRDDSVRDDSMRDDSVRDDVRDDVCVIFIQEWYGQYTVWKFKNSRLNRFKIDENYGLIFF